MPAEAFKFEVCVREAHFAVFQRNHGVDTGRKSNGDSAKALFFVGRLTPIADYRCSALFSG